MFYELDHAQADVLLPLAEKLGTMNCYCHQMFITYGEPGYNMIFPDGNQYCKEWHNTFSLSHYLSVTLGCWIALTNIAFTEIFRFIG